MRITVNLSDLESMMSRTAEQLRAGLAAAVEEVAEQTKTAALNNLKGDARGKHLMSSIQTEVQAQGDRAVGQVGCGAATGIDGEAGESFGIYVHEGTGIYSRTGMGRKDVPWFYMDAEGKGHLTSGMEANPFLENAYNEIAPQAAGIMAAKLMGGR